MAGGSVISTTRGRPVQKASPPRPPFRPCTDRFESSKSDQFETYNRARLCPAPSAFPPGLGLLVIVFPDSPLLLLGGKFPPRLVSSSRRRSFSLISGSGTGLENRGGGANRIASVGCDSSLGGKYRRPCDSLPSREQRAHHPRGEKKTCASK